jgi:uncharacterized Zn finger protein (UPF0148 family)
MIGGTMKLIEKKCPNCGANINFNLNDKEVKCSYCDTVFTIERDVTNIDEAIEKGKENLDKVLNSESFNLSVKDVKKIRTTVMIISAIIFLIVICFFVFIFINIMKQMR